MTRVSIPRRPDQSPTNTTDAASAISSFVTVDDLPSRASDDWKS